MVTRVVALSSEERDRVTAAVTAAEAGTDGEIVTIMAPRSDAYHDVVLHWALLSTLLALAVIAARPAFFLALLDRIDGWAPRPSTGALLALLLVILAAKFLAWRLILGIAPIRLAVTPSATKARRVRRRAVELFRVTVESRTRASTGVLLYLSLAERRAEIVADAAIHGKVAPEEWGEAMAALLAGIRAGQPGEGMAAAVARIGAVLAAHFPRSSDDTDELPDRLILL